MDRGVFEKLRSAADPARAAEMSAYMRDKFAFLGVQAQIRKKLCTVYIKAARKEPLDWEFVLECWGMPEREFQYLATDYLDRVKSRLSPSDIPNIRKLIVAKSWWDTVDALDVLMGDIALRHPEVNMILLEWSTDDNFWLRRVAIDHQLTRKDKTDAELLEKILVNNLGQDEFFINKSVGWSLREYSKTNPEWVRSFIAKHKDEMKPLSIREGSKYL